MGFKNAFGVYRLKELLFWARHAVDDMKGFRVDDITP